jgi:16S rRNA (cytosine967-C5)-methyltransferase|tara:strand:- start:18133 stop:19428 length:1296 start_codon:yes stop_codon:yes gene_type:complete
MANPRLLAAQALTSVLCHKGSLASSLPRALEAAEHGDRALIQQLCYGTCRHFPQLELIADQLLHKPMKPQDQDIYALILMGLYQIKAMRTPDYAAVDATVQAAKASGKRWADKLINGVLRSYIRGGAELAEVLNEHDAYRYNHPEWLVSKLSHHWPDDWQKIIAANDPQGPLTLRVNTRKISRMDYLVSLVDAGHAAHACHISEVGVQLAQATDVTQLPGFAEGWFSVQDEAPQLSAPLLQLEAGQRVLDACAAPGGKTCHLLEAEDVNVLAVELEQRRIGRMQENLQRMGLAAQIICADASEPDQWWDGQAFDRILLDAPCSATGVIRRNPDIKMLRTSEDILELVQLQLKLLNNLWPLLKPGGYLLYATCSVLRQENDRLVARFLKQQKQAQHCVIEADWGIKMEVGRQLLPDPTSHDGFYYAKLYKPL